VSAEPVLGGRFFPFDGNIQVRPLEEPIVPEPPRMGEPGGKPCGVCTEPEKNRVWHNERWTLHAGFEPNGIPMMALLYPIQHVTLHDLPAELAGELGIMIQRVAVAIGKIPGVGRAHFSRWGDGSEHFHLWFLARPLGMMQLRGPMLAVWDDLLPKVPDEEFQRNVRTMVAALSG
jgi:diadenosine tetraphosphate (Ap4A) HIT family hydrolase